uniref:ATP-dependent Clp protease proteolytic subunit n=1 Tax=Amphora coffeiformis TaxID=265554 RepID=A0A7S3L4J0_9STRA|mmetsp:Transcript_24660/g.46913  ORF Transcript_24660/g.46913 Transcript_24660/m.46913 type:complete len:266 (+) Transcript_24660:105-902(+)
MKFTSGVLWSLILSSAAAFGPKPLILPTTTTAAAKDGSSPLWRPSMNMAAGGAERAPEYYDGVRIGPPPDLPSLLLHNRIVYIGMPLVPAVTELVIAELLYLNYESTTEPITMYINSSGTTAANGQPVGFETEAFAIADVMKYVRPPVHTVAIGQAFGAAAMLLSQGKRGKRYALPNATILLNQPKSQARGQASDIAIKAREVAHNRRTTCELLASACGKPVQTVMEDCSRVKYLQPQEAVEYGLIDQVISSEVLAVKPSFMSSL